MLRSGHILQLAVVALLGLAVILVHSAGMTVAGSDQQMTSLMSLLCSRHSVYALLAVAAMMVTSRIDVYRLLRGRGLFSPVLWMMVLSLGLVGLALVPGVGKSVNGASRWLYLGPRGWGLSFQPSELLKWAMVLAVAGWCARRAAVMGSFRHGLGPVLALVGLSTGLVMIEDLGTGVLIGLVAVCLLAAGGAKLWQLIVLIPPAVGGVVLAIIHSPYRLMRLTAFMDPWADPLGNGYHPIQSMLAIAQGGLWGRGLGNGIQKFGYLPEDTTDFLFAVICEELGITGSLLVVGLYLAILWAGLAVARDCKNIFGRLLTIGVLLTVGFQAAINIAVVTVVIPTKGIALPLLSAGGTGWVLTAAALGLVAALDRANQLETGHSTAYADANLDLVTTAPAQ